ncbi:hypothetical protein R1sor_021543 [Riccia sorocarpa]|uniref:Uncharacterized protein n=1 Tax=Riccia sorocarpa TaxID=122646 RepID=A0ABD3GHC3_9MARC
MEDFAKNMGETTELKLELEAKEEELRKLQEADKKIRQKLKTAKRKGKELEGELKKIPAGVLDLCQTLPTAWIHEFCLDREVDFDALKERYMCSWDIRSLPPNAEVYDTEHDMLQITGVPQMRAQKTKWQQALGKALDAKTLQSFTPSKSNVRLWLTSAV